MRGARGSGAGARADRALLVRKAAPCAHGPKRPGAGHAAQRLAPREAALLRCSSPGWVAGLAAAGARGPCAA